MHVGCAAQEELGAKPAGSDSFAHYASMYDELIGRPCIDGFMASRDVDKRQWPEEIGKSLAAMHTCDSFPVLSLTPDG